MSKKRIRKERTPDHGNTTLIEYYRELHRLFHQPHSERMLIIVTHGLIELMVNLLIQEKLKNADKINSDRCNYPHSVQLVLLNEKGLLDDWFFEQLDWFRDLRNSAAHNAFFQLADADRQRIDRILRAGPVDPTWTESMEFGTFCSRLVEMFWNSHAQVFGPKLA